MWKNFQAREHEWESLNGPKWKGLRGDLEANFLYCYLHSSQIHNHILSKSKSSNTDLDRIRWVFMEIIYLALQSGAYKRCATEISIQPNPFIALNMWQSVVVCGTTSTRPLVDY